jgi:LysM repeat protein
MTQPSKAPARALAVIALVGAFVILAVLIGGAVGGGGSGGSHSNGSGGSAPQQASGEGGSQKKTPSSYVVKNGDTLTSIAHQTGVPVARIQQLNPEVDPQILISGEKLKLR